MHKPTARLSKGVLIAHHLVSWFNLVSHNPPVISVSCLNHDIRVKDTVRNIRATKGFTVNTVSEAFVDNANAYSIDAPPEISEWPLSGLTKEPSIHVKAPRVKESAFSMECELLQTVDIVEPNSLKATTTLVLGTVKLIHMRRDTLDPVRGLPDPGKLKPVMRLGGMTYAKLGDGFQVPLPAWENMKDEIRETLGKEVVTGRNN
ncbi:hypothetical protein AN958_01996 [Leucoagaricus sp. SymC.cos]|nr:hypothetical protein AN958_01996 [Leucoagaricus sp. SymC.cos]